MPKTTPAELAAHDPDELAPGASSVPPLPGTQPTPDNAPPSTPPSTPENTPLPGGGSWRWDIRRPGWVDVSAEPQ